MSVALQFIPLLVFLSLIALCLRISGRVLAATKIHWSLCFKYAAIVVLVLLPIRAFGASLGSAAVWVAPPLALGVQTLVGAFYLGSRVKKESGFDLGPITGAKVAAGGAFVSL